MDLLKVQKQNKTKTLNEIETQANQARDHFNSESRQFKQEEATLRGRFKKMLVDPDQLQSQQDYYKEKTTQWASRTDEIYSHISELEKRILNEAMLLATTLTKTFCSNQFPSNLFNVLILDEASMAPLPHLYWALGKCSQSVCIVGDFLQLPPICHSNSPIAKKWLQRNIYSLLEINDVGAASSDKRIELLKRQYRMVPQISIIPNKFFYHEQLEDDPSTLKRGNQSGLFKNPLVMVDTSDINPWCSKLSIGSRFNLHHALLSASLAKQLLSTKAIDRVGIITPYNAHAKLINKICKDWGIINSVKVSSVYRFQGGEESTIIFDTTEGNGLRVAPFLNDIFDKNAILQLNVAVTRSKNRLILIAHNKHIRKFLPTNAALIKILNYFNNHAEIHKANEFIESYSTEQFENYASQLLGPVLTNNDLENTVYSEKNFWPRFHNDLNNVNKRLIILSPFITINRAGKFMDFFKSKVENGIEIRIHTKPSRQQIGQMQNQHREMVKSLLQNGIKVFEISRMHQKLAILDSNISWEGSLNILSHNDAIEHMRRIESESAVEELVRNLELDDEYPVWYHTHEKCPKKDCDGHFVVRRRGHTGQKFLGCSNYPHCQETRNIQ